MKTKPFEIEILDELTRKVVDEIGRYVLNDTGFYEKIGERLDSKNKTPLDKGCQEFKHTWLFGIP